MFTFLKKVYKDLDRYRETYRIRKDHKSFCIIVIESLLFKPGFNSVLLFRVSNLFHRMRFNKLAWAVSRMNQFLTSAEIEYNADIGPGLFIAHPAGVVIGRGSKIGRNANIYQGVTLGTKDMNNVCFPVLEDFVTLFSGAKILGKIVIGSGTVVGANTVVVKDVPANSLVVGNKVIPDRGDKVVAFEKS